MHQLMAGTSRAIVEEIRAIQEQARDTSGHQNPAGPPTWPMIILRSPKGWTGPKIVDGQQVEGTYRAHQVPLSEVRSNPQHLKMLEEWMKSYRPEELFDKDGQLRPELAELAPRGDRRMGANPHANGGLLLRSPSMPDLVYY